MHRQYSPEATYDPYSSTEHFPSRAQPNPHDSLESDYRYPPVPSGGLHDTASNYHSTAYSGGATNDDWGQGEKQMNPVTRGSMAAQMAAEGQIPKKEGLRMWRSDEHAGALMQGGRGRCCGRVCCCSIILVIVLLVSIIASFFLWVRPPSVTFNGVEPPSTGSEVTLIRNGFVLNLQLNIGVVNPNFFGANFDTISADAFYSTRPNVPFGGGTLSNVDIPKNSRTTIRFPFSVNYTTALDPNLAVLRDIATKCGFIGGTISQLRINYTIRLALKVVAIRITPQFSSSTTFDCPLKESDISGLLGSGGLSGAGSAFSGRSLTLDDSSVFSGRELSPAEEEQVGVVLGKVMKRGFEESGLMSRED